MTNSISGEMAGDFMFWPTGKHRFGWFLEPAYDYSFAGGGMETCALSPAISRDVPNVVVKRFGLSLWPNWHRTEVL